MHQQSLRHGACPGTGERFLSSKHVMAYNTRNPSHQEYETCLQRRDLIFMVASTVSFVSTQSLSAHAIGFTKDLSKSRRKTGVSPDQYLDLDISSFGDGGVATLRYYDVLPGSTSLQGVQPGDTVSVHFDCLYRNIDAVSTRSARLLGENRVIAEPYQFVAGTQLDGPSPKAAASDAGGGLFSGQSGPKPPQALSYAVMGMKVGGKRSVFVPTSLGYGAKGEQEIPPNCERFELVIELLSCSSSD